jgi:hypothetical protein
LCRSRSGALRNEWPPKNPARDLQQFS